MLNKRLAALMNSVTIVTPHCQPRECLGARGQGRELCRNPTFLSSAQSQLQATRGPVSMAAFIALLKSVPIRGEMVAPAAPDRGETSRAQARGRGLGLV